MAKNQHISPVASPERSGDNKHVDSPDESVSYPKGISALLSHMGIFIDHRGYSRRFSFTRTRTNRGVWERYASFLLLGVAVISGFLTYAAMTEILPFENSSHAVIWLLNIDLIILLLFFSLTAKRIIELWNSRKKGVAGSQLQTRLILIFGFLAAVPAVIMTVFSAYFFHYGIQTWFSERVSVAVAESQAVAEAYLSEHQQVIRADIMAMAQDLNRNADKLKENMQGFERYVHTQIKFRNFSEAVIFARDQDLFVQAGHEGDRINLTPDEVLDEAEKGHVVLMATPNEDRVRALVKLEEFENGYLYVARSADPTVLSRVNATREAAARYNDLESQYSHLQIQTLMIFIVVALVLLLAAIWAGLILARQMTAPVTALINAAERVRSGDLTVRVPEFETLDELDYLSRAFNRMTSQIAMQRDELMQANRQLDNRRRFTEVILAGVPIGVMGVDPDGHISVANNPAAQLFTGEEKAEGKALIGRKIGDIVPGLPELLEQAHENPKSITQFELPYLNHTGRKRNLLVRIVFELVGEQDVRAVITFDDITDLQSAQRKAAWSDVARRIAHEIKNPLTPIQLSAERLKRKYLSQIKDNPEVFDQCIETIIRQVDDIGRMVNEFSSFARMPEPVMKEENLSNLVQDILFLHQQAGQDIEFLYQKSANINEQDVRILCDGQQVRQALTNLIQNAVDSLHEASSENKKRLQVILGKDESHLHVIVNDNGPGLPDHIEFERLTEPYITFKDKGTGLGLAIVKKIMEDHKGRLSFGTEYFSDLGHDLLKGAAVTLSFPLVGLYDDANENSSGKKIKMINNQAAGIET